MTLAKVVCPFCSCPVNIKKFGNGWVGICCREIIYNSAQPPVATIQENVEATKNIVSKRLSIDPPPQSAQRELLV